MALPPFVFIRVPVEIFSDRRASTRRFLRYLFALCRRSLHSFLAVTDPATRYADCLMAKQARERADGAARTHAASRISFGAVLQSARGIDLAVTTASLICPSSGRVYKGFGDIPR